MAVSTSLNRVRGLRVAPISHGFQPSKLLATSCAASRPRSHIARALIAGAACLLVTAGCADRSAEHERHMTRAETHLESGDLERARVDVLNALRVKPRSVEASLMGARIAIELSEWRRAAQLYQNALNEAPRNTEALVGLARIYVLAGQADEALELTERALVQAPEDPRTLTTHASALARDGASASAMVHVNSALRLAPGNEEAIALLAFLLERSGQPDAALDTLLDGIERAPTSERLIETLAELALALNDIDVAVDAQRRLIKLDPRNRDAHYQLARLLLHGGRFDDAQRELQRYLAIHPDDVTARLFLTESLTRRGEHEGAEATLASFLSERDDVPELRLLLANLIERRGDTDAALAAYRESIVAQGESVVALTARNNVARILIGRGDLDGARALLDDVLNRNAGDIEALTLSGYLHLRRGRPKRATADLRAARDGGAAGFVTSLLAQALWSQGDRAAAIAELEDHPDAPQATVLLARYEYEAGNLAAARPLVAQMLSADPLSMPANELNVELALLDDDLERAMLSARVIIDAHDDGPLGYHLAARVDRARGQLGSAEQHARRALELAPEAVEPLEFVLDLLLSNERADDARRLLDDLLTRRPAHAIALWWRGRLSLATGDGRTASEFFARATAATPAWPRPWLWRARLASAQGRSDAAMRVLDEGIAATDFAPELVAQRADLDRAAGNVDAAIELYRQLHRRQPDAPQIANNLAMLLLDAERDVQDLREARNLVAALDPGEDPKMHDTVGQVLARTCEFVRAEAAFRSALDTAPEHAGYQLRLASVLLEQSRRAEATALLDTLSQRALNDGERRQLDQLVRRAGGVTESPCVALSPENSS